MRSIAFTLLLLAAAAVAGGLALINLREGTLARVLGAPATPIGETLYDFDAGTVRDIYLSGNGVSAHCSFRDGAWRVMEPPDPARPDEPTEPKDLMDPRLANILVGFTLASRVEGAIPTEKVDSKAVFFEGNSIGVRLQDEQGDPLAKYILRNRAAWVGTNPETGESIPTVYVQPRDRSRKDYIYVCTDQADIHAALGDGFKRLRDHHPFLFDPGFVQDIRLKNRNGELTLSRKSSQQYWNIVKPLELKSDPAEVRTLVQGLIDLTAVDVRDRSEVTLPGKDAVVEQIALRFFHQPDEIVLNIYPPPPETPEAPTVSATVSNRPHTVFQLPRRKRAATNGSPGLADLPQSVNELRDPTLTSIRRESIRAILISRAGGEEILIERDDPAGTYRVRVGAELLEPNDTALYALLKTITELQVSRFVTDTASDLAPYGLDEPFLTLGFLGFDDSVIELRFGRAGDAAGGEEKLFAMRKGTPTVVEVERSVIGLIPTEPQEWRNTQLWRIAAADVLGVRRTLAGREPLELAYRFASGDWSARRGATDLTTSLSAARANIFLERLLDLRASYWLPRDHSEALAALASPTLALELLVQQYDDEGDRSGIARRTLTIATVKRGAGFLHYGRLSGEPSPFLLPSRTVEQLSVDLLEAGG